MEIELVENNRIVAEFMGYEGQFEEWCGSNILAMCDFISEKQLVPFNPESNWSDLMPVVEKIGKDKFEDYQDQNDRPYLRTFGMISKDGEIMVRFNRYGLCYGKTLIEATYNAVIEYIKSHNENNPQTK